MKIHNYKVVIRPIEMILYSYDYLRQRSWRGVIIAVCQSVCLCLSGYLKKLWIVHEFWEW